MILSHGTWPSPLDATQVAEAGVRLGGVQLAGKLLWWTEGRPAEAGRTALCARLVDGAAGAAGTLLPAPWNVRNRVHEYGGGSFAVGDGRVWFCHDGDHAIHEALFVVPDGRPSPGDAARLPAAGAPAAPVLAGAPLRLHGAEASDFADLTWFAGAGLLLAIAQDHGVGGQQPFNRLVAIEVAGPARGRARTLASGHDFFSNPTPSPDGRWLAWLSWDHPQMPWDGTTLWCAPWQDGELGAPRVVAGGTEESVFQPAWSPDGVLHWVSDRSGWWNLYREDPAAAGSVQALCVLEAEFGMAQWEFGMRSYGFLADGTLLAVARQHGAAQVGTIAGGGGPFRPLDLPWTDFRALQVGDRAAWCIAGGPGQGECLIRIDVARGAAQVLDQGPPALPAALVSVPEAISWPGSGGVTTHGFFYPPHLPGVAGPAGELPPLLVISHGGPTSATTATLRLSIQFWTTRGFAVLDVNYGGSTGYGRAYQRRLRGQWGIVDVEDVVTGAQWLAAQGRVDGTRMAIRGSSAGGFTTLAALAFHEVFRAGVSLYGIGDLALLAQDTHKFEARYLDSLVAPWPAGAAVYEARSPLAHSDRITGALLLLQGAEDRVVPPNQAATMFEAVRSKGLPVGYLLFPGEQHGFRRQETVVRALEAELYFYGRVFGFTPAGALPTIPLENLP